MSKTKVIPGHRKEALATVRTPPRGTSIGGYLIQRLQDYGIGHIFGLPGDYILQFYSDLEKSPIQLVTCTREDSAAFAADAYARLNGMGAVAVTYCVGGLSLCNPIAGAYAEKSSVIVITGSPGLRERNNNPLLHHRVRDFHTQRQVFEKICVACTELCDPSTAFYEIDRVLDAAASFKRPVYIEIPRDVVSLVPTDVAHYPYESVQSRSDKYALAEALQESTDRIQKAKRRIIIAGIEIHRFGLQNQVLKLAERTQTPIAVTILSKGVISEAHPLFVGLYEGGMGDQKVARFVEQSDCVLMLGTFLSDLNMGIDTANLDPGVCIHITSESLQIAHHAYHNVQLQDFITKLAATPLTAVSRVVIQPTRDVEEEFRLDRDSPIKINRMVARLNKSIDSDTIVLADIGNALFAAAELNIHGRSKFVSSAYYTTMGFAVPASIGAHFAQPNSRIVVIDGDGSFQMTGTELSTALHYGFSPIVIVLDNKGFGTQRLLQEGDWTFNEIQPWQYHRLPEILGGGKGYQVRTEGEFDKALVEAWENTDGPSLIHVYLSRYDCSKALGRLADRLRLKVERPGVTKESS